MNLSGASGIVADVAEKEQRLQGPASPFTAHTRYWYKIRALSPSTVVTLLPLWQAFS